MAIKWNLDPTHSEVSFKVKHMMITNVTGILGSFQVDAESDDEAFSNAKVKFTGDIKSISTNNEQRDQHLQSADFFDTENHPQIIFESTSYKEGKLDGNLTIRGITKPITLEVEFGGIGKDPWGNTKAGFTVNGKINRREFGLLWNASLETGGVLVSDEVKINGEIQLVKAQ
ncbi:MAG TPA: YceI family protein [Flavobacteriales bacterium]|jgi:polyisoprenoid-binding protein YceI